MPGYRDPEKSEDGLSEDGHQHKIARSAEHRRGVGEDEGADDIARRLLRHSQQRGQRDLLRLPLEYFQDRHAFDALFGPETDPHSFFGDVSLRLSAAASSCAGL